MSEPWIEWGEALATTLAGLREGEFLNTWGPTQTRDRGTGLFGRARAPQVLSAPVVRFAVTEGYLLGESVSPFPTAREPQLTDEQRGALSAAGWLMPGDEDYTPVGGEFLRVFLPQADAAGAAELAVKTYRILGVSDPQLVEQERGS